jgi:hypothetical protein
MNIATGGSGSGGGGGIGGCTAGPFIVSPPIHSRTLAPTHSRCCFCLLSSSNNSVVNVSLSMLKDKLADASGLAVIGSGVDEE